MGFEYWLDFVNSLDYSKPIQIRSLLLLIDIKLDFSKVEDFHCAFKAIKMASDSNEKLMTQLQKAFLKRAIETSDGAKVLLQMKSGAYAKELG